jgi:hypothetical protein
VRGGHAAVGLGLVGSKVNFNPSYPLQGIINTLGDKKLLLTADERLAAANGDLQRTMAGLGNSEVTSGNSDAINSTEAPNLLLKSRAGARHVKIEQIDPTASSLSSNQREPCEGGMTIIEQEAMHSRKAIYSNMPESDYGQDTGRS